MTLIYDVDHFPFAFSPSMTAFIRDHVTGGLWLSRE
jgi:hypothetical protein